MCSLERNSFPCLTAAVWETESIMRASWGISRGQAMAQALIRGVAHAAVRRMITACSPGQFMSRSPVKNLVSSEIKEVANPEDEELPDYDSENSCPEDADYELLDAEDYNSQTPIKNQEDKDDEGKQLRLYKEFDVLGEIGNGSFGRVFCAKMKLDQQLYAVKCIHVRMDRTKDEVEKTKRELLIHAALDHPNIVPYKFSWEEKTHKFPTPTKDVDRARILECETEIHVKHDLKFQGRILTLVMELCEQSLEKLLKSDNDRYYLQQVRRFWILELLRAMEYLHGQGILHRDVSPKNILVKKGSLKLSDFGLSNVTGTGIGSGPMGTPFYFAPELLFPLSQSPTTKSDMFALGVIVYELFCDTPVGLVRDAEIHAAKQCQFPAGWDELHPDLPTAFLSSMLAQNPEARFEATEALEFLDLSA